MTMRIYSLYTPPFAVFKEEWCLRTLPCDLEPHIELIEEGNELTYGSESFNKLMLRKVDLILRAIEENPGELFVYSDIDVQFFRPFGETVTQLCKDQDLLVQRDSPQGHICAGFMIVRSNPRCLALFDAVHSSLSSDYGRHGDQSALNSILICAGQGEPDSTMPWHARVERVFQRQGKSLSAMSQLPNAYQVKWNYLPEQFLNAGTIDGVRWQPGMKITLPADLVMHHANWTIGMEAKLEQLRLVSDMVSNIGASEDDDGMLAERLSTEP